MMRFEIDPAFAKKAVMQGRKLIVECQEKPRTIRVSLGDVSPHDRMAAAMAMRKAKQ